MYRIYRYRTSIPETETRYVYPVLVQCWAIVYDAGLTLNQHWVNLSCMLGYVPSKHGILKQCWPAVCDAGPTLSQHCFNVSGLLGTTMGCTLTAAIYPMLVQCWAVVYDAGPALKQHWVNLSCMLGYVHTWGVH